jgi:hypothetical protein
LNTVLGLDAAVRRHELVAYILAQQAGIKAGAGLVAQRKTH